MLTPDSPQLARDLGFESREEKQALIDSTVAIAGVGGAGFPLALALAREGVSSFRVADPDEIGLTSTNRHPGAFESTIGENKARELARMILDINSGATVAVYEDGVDEGNVEEFVSGADLVFDGIDFNSPAESVLLHRKARRMGATVLTGLEVGHAAVVTAFTPNGITFEAVNGYSEDDKPEQIREKTKDGVDMSSALPYIPRASTDISVMEAVKEGADLPSNVIGVDLFAAVATNEALKHLTAHIQGPKPNIAVRALRKLFGTEVVGNNRPAPAVAPDYRVVDLDRDVNTIVRASKLNFYRQAVIFQLRSQLKLNPAVNYDHAIPPKK